MVKEETVQTIITLKLYVCLATVDEYSRELTVSVKVCVPISVGSEMFAVLTAMVLESPDSEM
jgi:hypothetical protein